MTQRDRPPDKNSAREAPCLRADLEFIPVTYQGRKALIIKDSLGLVGEPLLLAGDGLLVLSLLGRRRSLKELQAELVRLKGGAPLSMAKIEALVDELESAYVLEGECYRLKKSRLEAEYAALPVRPASHAGQAYPADPAELARFLDAALGLAGNVPSGFPAGSVSGIVAPHIDLEVGRRVYAQAYAAARGLKPKAVLLMGTGHSLDDSTVSLSEKDFETPLGVVRTDRTLVKRLRTAAGRAAAPTDFGHRQEHSLEFQLLFLQHLFGSGFRLIPMLFGSLHKELSRAGRAGGLPSLSPVLEVMAEWLVRMGSEALVVAGVDFSHIGPKFGHRPAASVLRPEAERHDRLLIDALCRRDAEAFWGETRRVEDRFNVCGFSSLACLLEILPPGPGRLLGYDFWLEEPTRSAVSFAGLAFGRA